MTHRDRGDALLGIWRTGLPYYYLTSLIVALGLVFGDDILPRSTRLGHMFGYTKAVYANWDGQWYVKIASEGYSYDPESHSTVAFFPAYPLLGRLVSKLSGLRYDESLLAISNVLLALTFYLLARYVRQGSDELHPRQADYTLLALGLNPTSYFMRVNYSESLFLFLTLLVFWGIRRRWSLIVLAALVGLATATRAVGVALIPALVLVAWRRSNGLLGFAARLSYVLPIAAWGILGYTAYLYAEFGDPLAFAQTQTHWRLHPPASPGMRAVALATLEPIRTLYNPDGPAYATALGQSHNLLYSLRAADSFYFLGAVLLVAIGAIRGWITGYETLTAAGLILIPYATIGYEQYMQSMGRYSSVVLPVYLVLGRILCGIPAPVCAAIAAVSGFFLGVYAAMFAAWYPFL
jgi:hypothetical protein